MRPSQALRVLENLGNSFQGTLQRKRVSLSANDSQTVLEVYQQWLLLMIDLDYLNPDGDDFDRRLRRLWQDITKVDVYDLNVAMAGCLHCCYTQSRRGFKALTRVISPHLYNLIKESVEHAFDSSNVYAMKDLVQLFAYTSRLSLRDIDLTHEMLEDYMKVEDNMPQNFPSHLTFALNNVIKRWFGSSEPDDIRPQHGPGGVAGHGRASLEVKYKDLTTDARLQYVFGDAWWSPGLIRSSLDRISQTIFVPKSFKSFRTISMEPTTLQYLQQGVWKAIDRTVIHDRYLRNRIGFHDQERNRKLAQKGSIDTSYATIDLSAASDSVSYKLVKEVFRGTWLYKYLIALRSDRTLLPDGRVVALKKFAPMGSSLCFPVETILFAAICEFVTREHGVNGRYSVFGDDIIVPTQCVSDVMLVLETLGFSVNRSKSFYQEDIYFRESCGGEYFYGFDVTPMRISRQYMANDQLVRLTKLIELSNNAYKKGFKYLRAFFINKLRIEGYVALFSSTEMLADNYSNYHTERKWNSRLQRIDALVSTPTAKCEEADVSKQDEDIRYRHWLESTNGRTSLGDGFKSVICRTTVSYKVGWRMKPYERDDQAFIDFWLAKDGVLGLHPELV